MSHVCGFNASYIVGAPPQGPWPSHQRGVWPERGRYHLRGGCGARHGWEWDGSQGALNLWLCLLQSGETALHVAARYGHADVVQLLCSFGSNPNFQDKVGHGTWCPHFFLLFARVYRQPDDMFGSYGVLSKLGFLLRLQRAGTQTKALTFIHSFINPLDNPIILIL